MENRFGEYTNEVEKMIEIIKPAILLSLKGQQSLKKSDIKIKSDHSPVSICDLACQAVIVKGINENFPGDFILGEEDIKKTDQSFVSEAKKLLPDGVEIGSCSNLIHEITDEMHRVWVIDPIDGTYDFIEGGNYAIATALLVDLEVVCSVTAWPGHNPHLSGLHVDGPLIFVSAKGYGSYAVDMNNNYIRLINTGNTRHRMIRSFICRTYELEIMNKIMIDQKIREEVLDSSMTKGFVLAAGAACIYLRIRSRHDETVWDIAPFELVVREAGGFATDIDGKQLQYSKEGRVVGSNKGLIFTFKDQKFHDRVVSLYRKFYYKKINPTK